MEDRPNVYQQGAAEAGPNIPLAVVGAALGAGAGGLLWFLVEYYANYQVGFIAVLCGAAAGWGAVFLGKGHGFQVGVIAAVFGVLGIVGGSYGSFIAQKAEAKKELKSQGFPAEQVDAVIDDFGYVKYMKEQEAKDLAFMVIFGVIGLAYGFSVGSKGLQRGGDDA
jgi:hypothetical protein